MTLAARIRRARSPALAVALTALATASPARTPAAEEPAAAPSRVLPLGAAWARERGIDLPQPFGAGVFLVTMSRDIEVTDVRVSLRDGEPVSVSDVGDFAVRNHTILAAAKLDAWILPVLDVYVLGGHAWTDSRLNATI